MALKYQRILLKISGEALGGEKGTGFDEPTMDAICGGVKKAHELGVQIGIVVGGGNFWRGRSSGRMERTLADKIGMLATVMNALAVSDKLEQLGVPTEVFTSITLNNRSGHCADSQPTDLNSASTCSTRSEERRVGKECRL